MLYVQYGCGLSAPDGWLNFDASPALRIERLPVVGRFLRITGFPPNARVGNIVNGLPVADGSARGAYASHVLEHLTLSDCRTALCNTLRMLAPGGVFRLIVPDLEARARRYVEGGDGNLFMRSTMLGKEAQPSIRQRASLSAHLWMWDFRSMSAELAEAGFTSIRRASFGDADDPMFTRVEDRGRFVDGSITELAIEARRPA